VALQAVRGLAGYVQPGFQPFSAGSQDLSNVFFTELFAEAWSPSGPQLKADGKVTRGWMGVMIQKVTPEIAESLGLEEAKGALVADVVDDGPAEKAGIQVGDVIMTFAGNEVESSNDLPTLVAREPIGDEVPVVVWRDGEEATLELEIAQMEEDDSVLSDDMADEFGLSAQNLTPEISESLGMDPETKGVIVSGVEPGTSAGDAGLRRGDVILEVNRQPIKDLDAFHAKLAERKKGKSLLLLVRRGDSTVFLALKPPAD
jgi:serine protease Do